MFVLDEPATKLDTNCHLVRSGGFYFSKVSTQRHFVSTQAQWLVNFGTNQ